MLLLEIIGWKNSFDSQIELSLWSRPIWLSSEFFSSNYFQIGQHVVLLHIPSGQKNINNKNGTHPYSKLKSTPSPLPPGKYYVLTSSY